jgi:hypothetical protein
MSKDTLLCWVGYNSRGETSEMTPRDVYLVRAAELIAKVDGETDPELKAEFDNLARAYLRLAEQAERNDQTDIVYETPNKGPEHP